MQITDVWEGQKWFEDHCTLVIPLIFKHTCIHISLNIKYIHACVDVDTYVNNIYTAPTDLYNI